MRKLVWLFLWTAVPIFAQNYTVTAPRLTMHVGDPVPPCPVLVIDQTTQQGVGMGSKLFNGSPASCTVGATSSSPIGTYPLTISLGDLSPKSGGTITAVNGTIDVIPADANGAQLRETYPYPPGFTSGPAFPMINVTSNPICNMKHDNGTTDNTACLQNLLTYGGLRAKAGAIVSTSGTTVTGYQGIAYSNMNFTTIPAGTNIVINGTSYTVATVTSSSVLTLTTSAPTLTNVLMSVPTTVDTSGTTVTATNGISFTGLTGSVLINGLLYTISSVTDSTHLVTTTTLPTQTGVAFYAGNFSAKGIGRGSMYLYFPAGIYWIKGTVYVFDNYWTMIGDGPQQTAIKLAPNLPAFNQGSTPVPMIDVISNNGNENFSEIFENMGLRIAQGNPNAVAIQWPNNNMGSIENAQFWSEDSNANAAISMNVQYAGPTLFKNVAIYGFQTAINASSPVNEYSLTADQITMEGQEPQGQGCLCNMTTSFQHVLSDNTAPAWNSTSMGRGTLIDSELLSTNTSGTGIIIASDPHSDNQLYFKNVSCSGYGTCETDNGSTLTTLPAEDWTGGLAAAQTIFDSGSTPGSLNIPDTETPVPVDPASSTWTMLGSDPTLWCATIAGSSSTTVYLPPGTYTSSTKSIGCDIPDTVNHILMYDSKFAEASGSVLVTFTVAGSSSTPLVIEGCMNQSCIISHTGKRTVAMRDYNGGYVTQAGAGNVYFEDVATGGDAPTGNLQNGPTFYSGQLVTARQLDIETGTTTSDTTSYPKITCNNANIWILGYKTERDSSSIIENTGCQANLFGFWFYHTQVNPMDTPIQLTGASLFATGFDNWNKGGQPPNNYGPPYWVKETRQNGSVGYLNMFDYTGSSGQSMKMFYSYGATNQ